MHEKEGVYEGRFLEKSWKSSARVFEATVVSAIKLAAAAVELLALNHHGTQAGIHAWGRWSSIEAYSGTRINIDSPVCVLCDVSKCTPPHSLTPTRIAHILYLTDPAATRLSPRSPLGLCCPSRSIQAGRADTPPRCWLSLWLTDSTCSVWSRKVVCFELEVNFCG